MSAPARPSVTEAARHALAVAEEYRNSVRTDLRPHSDQMASVYRATGMLLAITRNNFSAVHDSEPCVLTWAELTGILDVVGELSETAKVLDGILPER